MARPRFHKTDPAKQEAILHAAAKEFIQVGYEGASINRILFAAGVSKGGFYYYFDDKADLACTVLLWAYGDVLATYERLRIPEDATGFWEEIDRFTRESLELLDRAPYANDLISRLSHAFVNDQELEARAFQMFGRIAAASRAFLTRGQELGVVRRDVPVSTLIAAFQGIKEALIREYTSNDHVLSHDEFERLRELQLDLFRRICEPGEKERR
jgi:AcrR family transcriptional regulator